MGYFSNSTEGLVYGERWCIRCVHNRNCAVWTAHLAFNYDRAQREVLDILIPRSKDGLSNNKCNMFKAVPGKNDPDDGEPLLFERHEIGGAPVEMKESA